MDPSGKLLKEFVQINNRMLDRFNDEEKKKLGVHVCSGLLVTSTSEIVELNFCILGNDKGSTHSLDVDYSRVLADVFDLHLNNFYLQLASEKNPDRILSIIGKLIQPQHRIFIGVINPIDLHVEKAEEVRDRVLKATKYIPVGQLGTTDDCGFAPYSDNESITREKCYEKIRARIEGTKMAEEILN
jgi:5-methyltetrahydropteroyltriglutamate--homocysteine methyltransferase